MPALPFKQQFAPAVESGEKLQTIRRVWKRPIKVGDTLYLKAGMRTKHCRSLGTTICTKVTPVAISRDHVRRGCYGWHWVPNVVLRRRRLYGAVAAKFALADGFRSTRAMLAWFDWQYGLPFEGVVIEWPCPDWPWASRRRGKLIRKEIAGRLSGAERSELGRLQRLADIIADAVDPLPRERLEDLPEDLRIREQAERSGA